VIYLFLAGELVGEAYCTEYLHRRVSIWEAQAERHADTVQAKAATAVSLSNRQRIQQEATAGRRLHALETKRFEKQRQMDLQRPEIHPSPVQTTLQAHAGQPSSPGPLHGQAAMLPPAEPEDDPPGKPAVPLPVRKRRRDDGESSI